MECRFSKEESEGMLTRCSRKKLLLRACEAQVKTCASSREADISMTVCAMLKLSTFRFTT
jgi:hypothetical protein